jgi:hypothetical protein
MAKIVWEIVDTIQCDRTGEPAHLMEERIYLDDPFPDLGQPHIVRARKCSLAEQCNLAGYACRWSFLNPNFDPFEQK